jgi:hypothetical protein
MVTNPGIINYNEDKIRNMRLDKFKYNIEKETTIDVERMLNNQKVKADKMRQAQF